MKWQRKWTICPKKKEIGALALQAEVAQRFNGTEENSSCPIAKQLLLLLSSGATIKTKISLLDVLQNVRIS
jgi:hypothetical protein